MFVDLLNQHLLNRIRKACGLRFGIFLYQGPGQGYGGEVIITLTVEDERISDLTAQGELAVLCGCFLQAKHRPENAPEDYCLYVRSKKYRQAFRRLWNRLRRLWVRM